MTAGWSPERTLRAKEILYRCMEELEATKAALYLRTGDGRFELLTSYGFARGDHLAEVIGAGHPLADWLESRGTETAWLDDGGKRGGLVRYLAEGGSTNLLTVPLLSGAALVGFVDARDKARRTDYGEGDVGPAGAIARALEELLGTAAPGGGRTRHTTPPVTAGNPPRGGPLERPAVESLLNALRPLAEVPGVAALALTVGDAALARTVLLGSAALDGPQRHALAAHQAARLAAAGLPHPPPTQWSWVERSTGDEEGRCETVHTTLLHEGRQAWMTLSVLGPAGSTSWRAVHAVAVEQVRVARELREYRLNARNLARILLEPGETSFPDLRRHAQAVSELAQRLATAIGLTPADEEVVTLAGYLHDIGMRELEYARIYRIAVPGERERRLYMRHPTVGARIVESAAFPGDLAGAIRHHHERWDGNGYPARLAGAAIPRASRIIHLAEVYDTLTSRNSYRQPIGREAALAAIRAEAGAQFDPELVPVFEKLV